MAVGDQVNYVAGGGNPPDLRPGVIAHEYPAGFDQGEYADIQIDQSPAEQRSGKPVETFYHALRSDNPLQPNTWDFA